MNSFNLHNRTHLFFGADKGQEFLDLITARSKRIFVVIGGGSVERLGYLPPVLDVLRRGRIAFEVFKNVEPNPDVSTISDAITFAREFKTDGFLAFGGGSVMDACKAIAVGTTLNEPDIWDFRVSGPRFRETFNDIPIYCVPTTAATASEVTPYAVISNRALKQKQSFMSPSMKSSASWLNPAYTVELNTVTTQDGAADILSHVFESYILGGIEAAVTDRYAEAIMASVLDTLPKLLRDMRSHRLRGDLLWASDLALNGYHAAGRAPSTMILHVLEHALSGVVPTLAHGRGLATLYPAYFEWLIENRRCVDRLAQLGQRLFGIDEEKEIRGAHLFVQHFSAWLRENGLWQPLSKLGFGGKEIDETVDILMKNSKGEGYDVAGPFREEHIRDIFAKTELQK